MIGNVTNNLNVNVNSNEARGRNIGDVASAKLIKGDVTFNSNVNVLVRDKARDTDM